MRSVLVLIGLSGCALSGCAAEDPVRCSAAISSDMPAATAPDWGALGLRNVLVLSIDTLRRDALGRYAGDPEATPFIDRLASEGVALDRHQSCSSWTLHGVACAVSGRAAEDLGFVPHLRPDVDEVEAVPDGNTLLAAWMRRAGWQTRLVSSNSYLSDTYGTADGFEESTVNPSLVAAGVVDMATGALDSIDASAPWLLQVHFVDPHAIYNPPVEYVIDEEDLSWDLSTQEGLDDATAAWDRLSNRKKTALYDAVRARYAGEVRYVDDQLARLFDALDARGMLDDTLVVVWSDHGEQLWDHGGRGHAQSLYGEETDAVGILWARGLEHVAWDGPTTHADLAPTIMASVGLTVPAAFTGAVVGQAAEDRVRLSLLWPRSGAPLQAADDGHVKLVYSWTGHKELFRRDADPCEQVNLYDPADPDAIRLWETLEAAVARAATLIPDWTPEEVGP